MTVDLRLQVIRRTVAELAASEGDVAGRLEQAQQLSSGHLDTLAAIQRLRPMVQTHRDQLATYLKDTAEAGPSEETTSPQSTPREATALSEVLRDLCLAFHHCALSYGMLYEMALRLYEPRLRAIAPKHLKAHADAALSTARLLPGVVAWQLAQDGLGCACICPMCSIGACGCVSLGTRTLTAAWCDAAPAESESPGVVLQNPKPGSQLARAGVKGGELLLAVDAQEVTTTDEIQAVIRKHALGDEVRFLIQRGSESPRELVVRHVSDYPTT
ncbi:PDZ domain-containing protein (plasmid) [Ensifer adhaerens]|uniref:PDZ domain-containing protein n=1 Tax=Ensifer adhaerens TaxID=106592 RepID=UPI0023A9B2C8|nr:PDZ domain-containing protein [Ensifer adhaerens]WDZ81768.1 PDZ domain-containing protein [Ensifer adhaerens]